MGYVGLFLTYLSTLNVALTIISSAFPAMSLMSICQQSESRERHNVRRRWLESPSGINWDGWSLLLLLPSLPSLSSSSRQTWSTRSSQLNPLRSGGEGAGVRITVNPADPRYAKQQNSVASVTSVLAVCHANKNEDILQLGLHTSAVAF